MERPPIASNPCILTASAARHAAGLIARCPSRDGVYPYDFCIVLDALSDRSYTSALLAYQTSLEYIHWSLVIVLPCPGFQDQLELASHGASESCARCRTVCLYYRLVNHPPGHWNSGGEVVQAVFHSPLSPNNSYHVHLDRLVSSLVCLNFRGAS